MRIMYDYSGLSYRINRIKKWLWTLLNHRAIIRRLEYEKREIKDNAYDIINELGANSDLTLTIRPGVQSFGWIILIKQLHTTIQGAAMSDVKLPNVYKIKSLIKRIREYIRKQNREVAEK